MTAATHPSDALPPGAAEPPAEVGSSRLDMPPSVVAASVVLGLVVLCAVIPGVLAPGDPHTIHPEQGLLGPSGAHLLGTDELGRDVFSRVIYGARSAVLGPAIIAAATFVISAVVSLVAGYYGGLTDSVISRVVDALYSLPPLIVAIVLVGVIGGGYWLAIAVFIVLNAPHVVRLLRGAVIERRVLPYIEAAETLGVPPRRIMWRHLFPNVLPLVVAAFFLRFCYGLIDLSSLSFLGLGVPPGSTDWGRMLAENRVVVFQNAWAAVAPGVALVLTGVSAVAIGDWLYDRFERRARSQ